MLIFGKAKENLSHARESSFSLEVRFLLTFVMLLITITLAVAIIFAAFGIFDINRSQTALLLEHELVTISENVETEYSIIASHAINLSKSLTLELEHCLDDLGITPSEIRDYPELLDKLMRSVYPTLSAELRALKSSGTFIILDATVNPSLENADSSRAGIFLKNISAQNNAFSTHYDLRYLYGPFDIGRDHGLSFLPQWKLEFDVSDMDFYNFPMQAATEFSDSSLSQLYYWSDKSFDGGSAYGMYCSAPLIASDGTVMGVCGFEVSTMQFKLAYSPSVTGQNYAFCMLASADSENIYFENAMFAGNYAVTEEQPKCTVSRPSGKGFLQYDCEEAGTFVGNHVSLHLYPNSSVFAENEFLLVLLTPAEQIVRITRESGIRYIGAVLILFIIGLIVSVLLCRKNIRPIKTALVDLKQNQRNSANRTRIKEIDDLFEFLDERDRQNEQELLRLERERTEAVAFGEQAQAEIRQLQNNRIVSEKLDNEKAELFALRLRELTSKEREVFNLYLQGMKAKEIADFLGIAFNTVKYHNKNIYDKLGISSRSELLLYANKLNLSFNER